MMDKMDGLYIPFILRDCFYLLAKFRKYRFLIFKLNEEDPSFVEIEHAGGPDSTIIDVGNLVPRDQCRWIVIDFVYSVNE
jgi:hypothetical protein